MKGKGLHIRVTERRLNKLRLYSTQKEKTMTQLIEEFIDTLQLEPNNQENTAINRVSTALQLIISD